jgi:hypothetical protein
VPAAYAATATVTIHSTLHPAALRVAPGTTGHLAQRRRRPAPDPYDIGSPLALCSLGSGWGLPAFLGLAWWRARVPAGGPGDR